MGTLCAVTMHKRQNHKKNNAQNSPDAQHFQRRNPQFITIYEHEIPTNAHESLSNIVYACE